MLEGKIDEALFELILECVDALDCPFHDASFRDQHIQKISDFLEDGLATVYQKTLLEGAVEVFGRHKNSSVADFMSGIPKEDVVLSKKLREIVPHSSQYLYHGTIQKRLQSIALNGLMPVDRPVWRGLVDAEHLARAVFFASTWRGALDWAEIAHSRTRGRKDSLGRTPVVVRIKIGELEVFKDPKATVPGSVMVKPVITSNGADVLMGCTKGFPSWKPINLVA